MPAMIVTGPVAGAITASIGHGIGTVESRAEPRSTTPSAVASPPIAEVEGSSGVAETETPAIPRVPTDVKTPRRWTGVVVIGGVPGSVVITGSVDDAVVRHIGPSVAGCVAYIDYLGRRLVDLDIGYVVVGVGGRNGVDNVGNVVANGPRSGRRGGDIPDPLMAPVVGAFGKDDGRGGVDRILHFRFFDRFKLWLTVVLDIIVGAAPLDAGSLRDTLLKQGIPAFIGSRDARPEVADIGIGRNFGKGIRDLVVGHPLPGTVVEVGRSEPSSGEQNVELLRCDVEDDV